MKVVYERRQARSVLCASAPRPRKKGEWVRRRMVTRAKVVRGCGMSRSIRIEFESAFYHVMARGNRCADIVFDDANRQSFVRTLREACERTGWRVHAFVLMSNH